MPNQSIIRINVDHNLIWFTQFINEEVHVRQGSQMLGCVNQFQSVIQTIFLLLQIFYQALRLLRWRIIIHVDHMEICVVLTLQSGEELLISIL